MMSLFVRINIIVRAAELSLYHIYTFCVCIMQCIVLKWYNYTELLVNFIKDCKLYIKSHIQLNVQVGMCAVTCTVHIQRSWMLQIYFMQQILILEITKSESVPHKHIHKLWKHTILSNASIIIIGFDLLVFAVLNVNTSFAGLYAA